MGLSEWSFVTALVSGQLISIDGKLADGTVRDLCTGGGWDIVHAVFEPVSDDVDNWYLILSRPLQPMMPTRGHLDDAVMIGAA